MLDEKDYPAFFEEVKHFFDRKDLLLIIRVNEELTDTQKDFLYNELNIKNDK